MRETTVLTPSSAGRELGLSPSRVRQLVDDGRLAGELTPLGRLISRESVERLREQRAAKATKQPDQI